MPRFSKVSMQRLDTVHEDLQRLFLRVVRYYDCSVIAGHRTKYDQNLAQANKRSKVRWPESKHNSFPSTAIDVVPYPINWGNVGTEMQRRKAISRFYHFAGYVLRMSEELDITLRWGGDWDSDKEFTDQDFDDLVHWEIVND